MNHCLLSSESRRGSMIKNVKKKPALVRPEAVDELISIYADFWCTV